MVDTQYDKTHAYIIGAGGFGRELESWTAQTKEFTDQYKLIGYLDDNQNALDGYNNDLHIHYDLSPLSLGLVKNVLMGIANPMIKEKISVQISENDISFISFRHATTIVGKNVNLGAGVVLCPLTVISCNVNIGKFVTVNSGSQIGHDVSIGDFTSIMANVDIGGGTFIGKHVFIGSNATILPGVKLPDHCRIGAGSVVIKSIKHAGTYFGNPAKRII